MPRKFINKDGNHVTPAFLNYARPLVGAMPEVERIAAPEVKRLLPKK
jgi:hypothetical protein